MLTDHPQRVCVFCVAEYDAQLEFFGRQWAAAEAVQTHFKAPHWQASIAGVFFRDAARQAIFVLEHRRSFIQTLSFAPWQGDAGEYVAALKVGLEKLGVTKITRLAFKVMAFLPLSMSHAEMVALLPGSFLCPGKEIEGITGKLEDAFVQLHGTHKDMKLQLMVAPSTAEQAGQAYMTIANLESFVENKLLDQGVREFRDAVAMDCLYVDVLLSRMNVGPADVHLFVPRAIEGAKAVSEAAVRHLQSMRAKR